MRNVVVTGASRGLGLAISRRLASVGYRVIAIARRQTDELAAAAEAARQPDEDGAGGALHFKSFDLSETTGIRRLVKEIRAEFGPLYGLVNNAGIGTGGLLAMMTDGQIESLVRLNTLAVLLLTKYVIRSMMSDAAGRMLDRGGRIVNVSSIVSFTGYRGLSVYSATKSSLVGFTRSLAREVGPLGINVNAIAPGFVDTEMTEGMAAEERGKIIRRSALHRLASADDIAQTVEFLLGAQSRNITGTMLTVDAGSTA
ncbi:MAG: SDR family NAD(P)-dependent oxidoreductase [Steroidobacteraceae bacterium]